jgi:hypothetical protein
MIILVNVAGPLPEYGVLTPKHVAVILVLYIGIYSLTQHILTV